MRRSGRVISSLTPRRRRAWRVSKTTLSITTTWAPTTRMSNTSTSSKSQTHRQTIARIRTITTTIVVMRTICRLGRRSIRGRWRRVSWRRCRIGWGGCWWIWRRILLCWGTNNRGLITLVRICRRLRIRAVYRASWPRRRRGSVSISNSNRMKIIIATITNIKINKLTKYTTHKVHIASSRYLWCWRRMK